MNSNTIKTYALIGTSLVSVALLYRNFYLAGLLEGALKSRKKQETPSDDLKAILDLMDCPL